MFKQHRKAFRGSFRTSQFLSHYSGCALSGSEHRQKDATLLIPNEACSLLCPTSTPGMQHNQLYIPVGTAKPQGQQGPDKPLSVYQYQHNCQPSRCATLTGHPYSAVRSLGATLSSNTTSSAPIHQLQQAAPGAHLNPGEEHGCCPDLPGTLPRASDRDGNAQGDFSWDHALLAALLRNISELFPTQLSSCCSSVFHPFPQGHYALERCYMPVLLVNSWGCLSCVKRICLSCESQPRTLFPQFLPFSKANEQVPRLFFRSCIYVPLG